MKPAVWAALVMLFSGCVNPEYVAPSLEAPGKYVGGGTESLQAATGQAWWQGLNDPVLNDLVMIGLTQNLDVQTALERVVAARDNTRLFGVEQQIDGTVSWDARRQGVGGVLSNDANLTGDAFFVLDLFGEYAQARNQSLAELNAAEYDAGTVKLAYLSDIVSSYIQVRYFQQAAKITRETIASRRQTLAFARQRANVREGTQLEVAQAQSLLASAQATLPILTAQAKVSTFRIATLLNVPAGVVAYKISRYSAIPNPAGDPNAGVPADLLRNRPDVRAAERRYAAAFAAVGVSRAQLYPSLRLTGGVTVGEVNSWSFGPTVNLPVLDHGRRLAFRDIAISNARQAELGYRKTFVQAIEDVQTAMVLTEARHAQVTAYVRANSSAERVQNLARRSYEAGLVTIADVLDAERTRLNDRLNLARARNDYALAWVQQQIAVGKGWTTDTHLAGREVAN